MEQPNRWVVIKVSQEGVDDIYKVFATWMGGYLGGDAWRMNSGIAGVEEDDNHYIFNGYSGSQYKCQKGAYGMSGYSGGILANLTASAKEVGAEITILDKDYDFMNLLTKED